MSRQQVKEQIAQHTYSESSRHRAGHTAGIHPDDVPYTTEDRQRYRYTMRRPVSHDVYTDDAAEDDAIYNTPSHTSVRRYTLAPPPETEIRVTHHRASRAATRTQEPTIRRPPAPAPTRRSHWLVPVGVGMLLMLALWIGGNIALSGWTTLQNDLHYGRPRTTQVDARVGHDDTQTPSHFIAVNLSGHILIVEFPGGSAANAKAYVGPILAPGNDLDPVTLEFRDVNGDGKPDMIVSVSDVREVFINDNGSFRPMRPGEKVTL